MPQFFDRLTIDDPRTLFIGTLAMCHHTRADTPRSSKTGAPSKTNRGKLRIFVAALTVQNGRVTADIASSKLRVE